MWNFISCKGVFLEVIVGSVRDVNGCCFVVGTTRGALNLLIAGEPDHHEVMSVNKLREAVALDKYARRFHARESFFDSLLDLVVSGDQPMDVRSARVPVTASVFSFFVGLVPTGTNKGLFR